MGIDDGDTRLSILSDSVFAAVSQTKSPQGLMAVVKVCRYTLEDIISRSTEDKSYLILESIQDPGNLGTIMRTAEAAGISGVIIGGESCDMYNPKVVRSTMGAIFRVPFIYTDNLVETINQLKAQGVTVYGAHLKGTNLYAEAFDGPVAFLIGNEGNGLSEEVSVTATRLIKIPMAGKVESLNAATSAALLSYEVYRQRLGKNGHCK
jgi:TrmH family RNA methyltransferase